MASVNKVTIIGRLGKDPEIRSTQSGRKIASMSVATSESWTDKASGERKEQTEWHRVVIMNENLAGIAEKYLKKGHQVYLEGKLQTRKWTDNAGAEKYTTEVILGMYGSALVLLEKSDGTSSAAGGTRPATTGTKSAPTRDAGGWDDGPSHDIDDEIPF